MDKKSILVIDDDRNILAIIEMYLKKEGCTVTTCERGDTALEAFHKAKPNLVVLDVMLPGMDGWGVLGKIREESDVPVIMLTAKSDTMDRIQGLDLGADDYISKPFSIREVLVRIRAVLRRSGEQSSEEEHNLIKYQGLILNLDNKTLSIDGHDVPVTKTEFEIMHTLLDEKGRVFSRQELIDRIWPDDVLVLDRTVDVNITRLRKKVGPYSKCIVTRLGFGYYFDA